MLDDHSYASSRLKYKTENSNLSGTEPMTAYSFWNNKGGVGKSFLCFVAASEYAHRFPESDVYVIDLCPQANVSEILLGGSVGGAKTLISMLDRTPRATVAGYLEARLNSPFKMVADVSEYATRVYDKNKQIPKNLYLVSGDNLLEVLAEAIRQTSQLLIPANSWKQVLCWIKDLTSTLRERSGERDSIFIIDCNPSFAIYTQLALVASDFVVIPFTADDSSRRGIENVVALLYGIGDPGSSAYARLSFSKRAREEGVELPRLHTFVSNRVTMYEGQPSKAFKAISKTIKATLDQIHKTHRTIFATPSRAPSETFIDIPDYHSACIVSSYFGMPLHRVTAGPKTVSEERVQLNPDPLGRYKTALSNFVGRF